MIAFINERSMLIADVYMDNLENEISLSSLHAGLIRFWRRNVDSVSVWNETDTQTLAPTPLCIALCFFLTSSSLVSFNFFGDFSGCFDSLNNLPPPFRVFCVSMS